MKACYFGTYEQGYPRNRVVIKGLRKAGIDITEIHEPVLETNRHKVGDFLAPASLTKLGFKYLRAYTKLGWRSFTSNPQVFITGYMGQLDTLALKTLKMFSDVPILFNPLISLYHTFTEARDLASSKSFMGRLCYILDYLSVRSSTKIILDTESHAEYFSKTFDISPKQIETVYVGADEQTFSPRKKPSDFKPFKVLFYGKFAQIHGLEHIMQAIELLRDEEIEFTIVGSGQLDEFVENKVSTFNGKKLTRLDWVPYERLSELISDHHLCLGIFSELKKARMVIPNKIFQSIACKRPVLTGNTRAVKEVFTENKDIFLSSPGNPEELADKIHSLSRNKNLLNSVAREGYKLFVRKFSSKAIGERVKTLLNNFMN